jgi:hypothetical protein
VKYITSTASSWDHRPYWEYLKTVQMPAHIQAFAANEENHDLKSPNSLHDAWLES